MPVESHKAQREAMQSSKQSDFERDCAANTNVLSNPTTLARAAARNVRKNNARAAFASDLGVGTLTPSNPDLQAIGSWARYLGLGTLA